MNNSVFKNIILESTGASGLEKVEEIQQLWSGYGSISRYILFNGRTDKVVVKHVRYPDEVSHPRGWSTGLSHQRKEKSYKVETYWYKNWSHLCDENCYVPDCYALDVHSEEVLMVFEDLNNTGFGLRKSSVTWNEMKLCLKWLAHFHATFLGKKPGGLWEIGTYWHLDTRPDELEVLDDILLKNSADKLDNKLNNAKYLTFVHGDAKLANFCFSINADKVAAVDFQYVGGGCGMKDVAYFVGSCLYEEECEKFESKILDYYLNELKKAVCIKNKKIDVDELEQEWRSLYHVAWTDFHRFIKGWSPGHWKINSYSEKIAKKVLEEL